MLLADCICTSSKQPISLVTVGCLQGYKHSDVAGLELVGGVRGEATQDNIVFETKLQGFEGLMRPETITNQHPWFLVSLSSSLGIKHALEPLQANLGVGIPRFGARIVPSRGGERSPVASMGGGWPNNH
jgi:hypothetical protein